MSSADTNILVAFGNLVEGAQTTLVDSATSHNRMNQMGESLEVYVKDLFCDSFEMSDAEKMKEYNKHFSCLGNQNNPPDMMLFGGDAIEVKKIEDVAPQLALNSSHPKDCLHADDPRLTKDNQEREQWTVKDMIYVVGRVKKKEIGYLWFVYGDCYAARRETYTRISTAISSGVNSLPDIDFEETKELARVNAVDPLGITYLRIRGMWGIENPVKVFKYIPEAKGKFANLLMRADKYDSFPAKDRSRLEGLVGKDFGIFDVKIKDPNNPAKLLDAKLLSYGSQLAT